MAYKILLFIIICFYSTRTLSQANNVDSLKKLIATQKEDSNKVKTLVEVIKFYRQNAALQTALHYAEQTISLSNKLNDPIWHGKAYQQQGFNYFVLQNYKESIKYHLLALNEFLKTGNESAIGTCYYYILVAYQADGNYPEAIKYSYLGIKYLEKTDKKSDLANCYDQLGNLYNDQGDDTSAIKNCMIALNIREKTGNKLSIAISYNSIGYIYFTNGRFPEALSKQLDALKIYRSLNDSSNDYIVAWTQDNIGCAYAQLGRQLALQGEHEKANTYFSNGLSYCLPALKVFLRINSSNDIASIYGDLGSIYTATGEYATANDYLQKALQLSKKINYNFDLRETYKFLYMLDSAQGHFDEAFKNHKLYINYRDSIANQQNTFKLTQEKSKYDFDKKEAQAIAEQEKKDLNERRKRNIQLTALSAFLILSVFLFWNNRQKQKAKSKIEKAYTELKATQAQLIQSEKMASLGQLTAGIAHEIQNPLNFVNNFSDVNKELLEEMKGEMIAGNKDEAVAIANDIIDNEEKINHHGKRAEAIVKGMLQHSRGNSGKKESTDINTLADEYLRLSYHGFRAKDSSFNATIKTDFDETIGKINIIPQDIGRVLLNLYNNAFYATNEKIKNRNEKYEPEIFVSTKAARTASGAGCIIITVRDNGNGIPQNTVDKIFQPFFTTKPTGQGTGLGLSLSYDIVKAHGGQIAVNTKENEFTEFIVQLPV